MNIYRNFEELKQAHPKVAEELLSSVDNGDWQSEELYYYEDLESFASYEVCDGWYSSLINADLSELDYHGAPNLYDFIDLKELGVMLAQTWDNSVSFKSSNNEVVTTSAEWDIKG